MRWFTMDDTDAMPAIRSRVWAMMSDIGLQNKFVETPNRGHRPPCRDPRPSGRSALGCRSDAERVRLEVTSAVACGELWAAGTISAFSTNLLFRSNLVLL